MVKQGYRDMPYHNWWHAISVAHFSFLLYENCDHLSLLSDLEKLAFFISCLCHDIDHRGTNNAFQISSVRSRTYILIKLLSNLFFFKVSVFSKNCFFTVNSSFGGHESFQLMSYSSYLICLSHPLDQCTCTCTCIYNILYMYIHVHVCV